MIRYNQIPVRARDENGIQGECDPLDLDDQSFRIWIIAHVAHLGGIPMIAGNSPIIQGNKEWPMLNAKPGIRFDKDAKK